LAGASATAGVALIANSSVKLTAGPSSTVTTQLVTPNAAGTLDLGSNSLYWNNLYVNLVGRQAQLVVGGGGVTLPSGISTAFGVWDNAIGSLGTIAMWSQSNNAANATATGTVRLETGNKTAGTGASGDVKIRIGTSSGGTRGSLYIADGSEGTIGYVWTSTDATGKGHWAPGSASVGVTPHVEYRTITSGEASANALTLALTPAVPANTMVDIILGDSQVYNVDYAVSGATLTWNSYALAGMLSAGDILRIVYWT
jgi:hypothetical protein